MEGEAMPRTIAKVASNLRLQKHDKTIIFLRVHY